MRKAIKSAADQAVEVIAYAFIFGMTIAIIVGTFYIISERWGLCT